MSIVMTCPESSFNPVTGVCDNPVWVSQPSLLPPLSAEEGLIISSAMITACASAWALKIIRRYIWTRA